MAIVDSAVEWNSMWHAWWMEWGCQGVHRSTGAEEGAEAGGGNRLRGSASYSNGHHWSTCLLQLGHPSYNDQICSTLQCSGRGRPVVVSKCRPKHYLREQTKLYK